MIVFCPKKLGGRFKFTTSKPAELQHEHSLETLGVIHPCSQQVEGFIYPPGGEIRSSCTNSRNMQKKHFSRQRLVVQDLHVRVWVEAKSGGQRGGEDGASGGSIDELLEVDVPQDDNWARDEQVERRAERHRPIHRPAPAD